MTDQDLIKSLGGPTKLAALLGYDKAKGGVQRVQNWLSRGIPPKVKVDHPDIFLRAKRRTARKPAATPTPAEQGAVHG